MFDLRGKVVVITGASGGIGCGIARAMAKAGAAVVLTSRSIEGLERTASETRARGAETLVVPADITQPAALDHLVRRSLDEYGYIDCWVNNAGSASAADVGPLIDLSEQQWDAVVDLNLKWTFFACQRAARAMTSGGSIVNISSRSVSTESDDRAIRRRKGRRRESDGHHGRRMGASPYTRECDRTRRDHDGRLDGEHRIPAPASDRDDPTPSPRRTG